MLTKGTLKYFKKYLCTILAAAILKRFEVLTSNFSFLRSFERGTTKGASPFEKKKVGLRYPRPPKGALPKSLRGLKSSSL